MLICTECKKEFKSYCGLTTHAAKIHRFSIEQSYITFKLKGARPSCAYSGCQEIPYFMGGTRGFSTNCSKHRGKWQEGLTVADERIARRGRAISAAQLAGKHWSNDPVACLTVVTKISYARRLRPKLIKIEKYPGLSKGSSWSKGLNRYIDPRLAAMGDAVRNSLRETGAAIWSKGSTKLTDPRLLKISHCKRLNNDEVLRRLECRASEFKLLSPIDDYQLRQSMLDFQCLLCGNIVKKSLSMIETGSKCWNCFPRGLTSKFQLELFNFVKGLGFEPQQTKKIIQPLEIDVYVPEKKFGIELNGLYWHSEKAGKDKSYHQFKSDACHKAGVRLLHVFEDEWRDKRPLIESMVKHALGLTKNKISARDCRLDRCSSNEAADFFSMSHIDGNVANRMTFCLKLDGIIVSCLSLRRPFMHADNGTIEIARFASLPGCVIAGGLSKLVNHAKNWARMNSYKRIITYADQRLGQISSYENAGFKRINDTSCRFWWTDFHERFNRFTFKATAEKRQIEVAQDAGVSRIWGCKNSKYVMEL